MKKIFFILTFILVVFSLSTSYAQYDHNWAVGLRVGEPLGLNLRKYFHNGENAFDLNVGTYGFLYNKTVKYNGGYYRSTGLAIQGNYLWNREIKEWFHVYYGFGGQINSRTFYETIIGFAGEVPTKKIAVGGSGTAGAEFKLPNSDLAVFVDAGMYLEMLPSPFHYNPEISAGLRLNLIK